MTARPQSIGSALHAFAHGLKSKSGMEDVGRSLAALGALFAMPELMITNVEAVLTAPAMAVVFSARSLPDLHGFLAGRSLAKHPVFSRAWQDDAPLSLSDARKDLKLSDGELWDLMPPWSRGNEALSINVKTAPGRHLNFVYAGRHADVAGTSRSVLLVASAMAAERLAHLEHDDGGPKLTTRERDVLRLIADGKTDVGVAAELGVAPRTVRFHIENAKRKLGVATRAQAVLLVLRGDLA
jgi:DNA-binding CsgD family transcriptional regulator